MQKVFMDAVGKDKAVNLDLLSKRAGYWFRFENKTDNLKLEEKGKKAKTVESADLTSTEIITMCKSSSPLDILEKLFDTKAAAVELRIIEQLLENTKLSSELVNFLIAFVIANTDNFPTYNYFEKIAVDWQRKGFKTIEEAVEYIKTRNKRKVTGNTRQKNLLPKDIESDWLDDYIKNF
jgi:replication initiation and membrane attachment protein